MVRIKNRILENPEGKVGNVFYRTMNGNTFASSSPAKYNASQSSKAKQNTNNKNCKLFTYLINLKDCRNRSLTML